MNTPAQAAVPSAVPSTTPTAGMRSSGSTSGLRTGPVRLPAAPVIAAVEAAAATRGVRPGSLFGSDVALRRAFQRARTCDEVSLLLVERLCHLLLRHPSELYGVAYEAATARRQAYRRPRASRPHWLTTIPLVMFQTLWDRMQAEATDGCWTGYLSELVDAVNAHLGADVDLSYRPVRNAMLRRGWIHCERRGSGAKLRDGGLAHASVWRLLRRPEPDSRPCEVCGTTIHGVTDDGYLTLRMARYCSPACNSRAASVTYVRELDRLRRSVGLAATGGRILSVHEIRRVLTTLRRLQSAA